MLKEVAGEKALESRNQVREELQVDDVCKFSQSLQNRS
jgi:hypothetical protein